MYVNSPGSENASYSLTFLGKKVGRHRTVAPAGKQRAWEKTNRSTCPEDPNVSSRAGRVPAAAPVLEDLPGSVPELRDESPCPIIHNTHFDRHGDETTAVIHHKALWLRRWASFRRWIGADQGKHTGQEVNQGSSESQLSDGSDADQAMEADGSQDVKIYIPYESAEDCVTQIAEDMEAMKRRHLEMVQELEENFHIAARENQERTVQRIKAHYQNKLNTLRGILDLYKEKVEKRNADWEKRVVILTAQNKQLLEEQRAETRKSEEEALQWHREKSKMLELFSDRLDLLHSHQASTLQELQMARQEVGKVQEMLMVSSQEAEKRGATEEGESSENKGSEAQQHTATCTETDLPLEGVKARLEELKASLYLKEREITELLERSPIPPIPPIPRPPCNVLLTNVVHKAHAVCRAVPETRTILEQLIEENRVALVEARDKLGHLQVTTAERSDREQNTEEKGSGEYESRLSLLQETVREYEVAQMALDCIRTGEIPVTNDCDAVLDLEEILGRGTNQTSEEVKSVGQKLLLIQDELKETKEEKKKIIDNYTAERTMRKKYYNMVEDMKGKIRVFCRIRPVSRAEQGGAVVVEKIDDYSVAVETPRGLREFQFDQVFSAEASQEDLFHDTNRLIQSTIDGYNVCIFTYGQTGSGKTFTMVGDKEQKNPGIMPRAFSAIFDLIKENSTRSDFKVSAYMLELYNDKLQDLFGLAGEAHAQPQSQSQTRRVEIKRNRKGVVFAQGAETKDAKSAQELYILFQQACANRHISATRMNMESSRSHLIVGIKVESKNLTNGSVSSGKLSLVDLAGSERAAKTGAKDHQLKEANSINKSLSALGDVISALSSELPHVPYRNSKLTQVMQDSLGGNAKTLMIVNVSPSECNIDETLTSLIYATRVKTITNTAQRNLDSKEIAQLKEVILKMKSGQSVEDEEV